jgi:hypothetical protein
MGSSWAEHILRVGQLGRRGFVRAAKSFVAVTLGAASKGRGAYLSLITAANDFF